jgi:cobalt-zinc-cadmium efflux system membrane fusion protein
MSGKQMVIVFLAVLVGSLASATAIRYVAPVGQLVLTAPTGIPILDKHMAFKPTSASDETKTGVASNSKQDHQGHGDEKLREGADHGHKDDDHQGHGDQQADDPTGHEDQKDGDHEAHGDQQTKTERQNHDDHSDHDDHGEERVVKLGEAEQREFGIEVETANSGTLRQHATLPGEIALNADRQAHVVPRVPGVVQAVYKTLGDHVRAGDVLAILESRELADLKSAYLTAAEQAALAQSTFNRETDLRQQKITSEQEYLQAKQELAAAKIAQRAAAQKLLALGFSEQDLASLPNQSGATLTRYAITAPFDGTIIARHSSLGELLQDDKAAFVIADLSTVWVDLRVYPTDLPFVRIGQTAVISAGHGIPDVEGTIAYMEPVIGEQTRTSLARVILPNPDRLWRPGLFVTATVDVKSHEVSFLVPKTALQTVDDQPMVFIQTAEGFVPQTVTFGHKNDVHVEVTSGLKPGQRYATRGTFTLKAQLAKGSFGDGHNH